MASEGAVFGGEHSGHFYFANFWNADSGMLAALHVISALGNTNPGTTLSSLLQEFDRYSASGEINSKVKDAKQVMNRIKEIYAAQNSLAIDDLDGITVSAGDWWFNVRASNTEPLLRLNVEAESSELMNYIKNEVLGVING
jgi:phosphomannomutase